MGQQTSQVEQGTERQAEAEFDMDALERKIGAGLDAFNNGENVNDAVTAVSSSDEPTPDAPNAEVAGDESASTEEGTQPDDADGDAAAEDETEPGEEAQKATPAKSGSSTAPTLPDAVRRSLYAYGWEDDQIDTNLKTLGADFIRTASQIHSNRSQELSSWAEMGRRNQEQTLAPSQTGAVADPNAPSVLTPIDTKKMKEKYGEDAMIDEIVGPVNQVITRINAVLPQIQQGQTTVEGAGNIQLATLINEFFTSQDMKGYSELYGDKAATPEQREARNRVVELADQICYGAQAQRRRISVEEALMAAHDVVSADTRKKAIRNEIRSAVKNRSKSVSLKPSGRANRPNPNTKPRNERELEAKVGAAMEKAFGVPNH